MRFRRIAITALLTFSLASLAAAAEPADNQPRAGETADAAAYRMAHRTTLRLWSFLGPTTNRTALVVAALLGRTDLYLSFALLPANAWLLVCYLLDRRVRA